MYQRPFQKIQAQTTAHLAQTMSLLNMNIGELDQEIDKALNENPALVVCDEIHCLKCGYVIQPDQICPRCSSKALESGSDSIVFVSQKEDFFRKETQDVDEFFPDEQFGQQEIGLDEYILTQIAADLLEEERTIAAYILNQLDEDGFFTESLLEVANYYHVPLDIVEKVKRMIQRADPLGAGSSSAQEAIKFQLNILMESGNIPAFYVSIGETHLQTLLKKNFKTISKDLNLPIEEVSKAADFFSRNLNPFPARAHWGTFRQPGRQDHLTYSHPDVIIRKQEESEDLHLIVEIMVPGNSFLELNALYAEALKNANDEVKDDLKNDWGKAQLFIKCLQQRNNTMENLLARLVSIQKDFILKGEKFLKPITRVELSKMLNVHESTISRAVANKSVQLPDGRMIPMALFFDKSLSIRTQLRELIEHENKAAPLSDAALVSQLKKCGHKLARRTVAKYRAMEGILSAYQRKNTP